MPPGIGFFERLMPAAQQGSASVRAVLPSRLALDARGGAGERPDIERIAERDVADRTSGSVHGLTGRRDEGSLPGRAVADAHRRRDVEATAMGAEMNAATKHDLPALAEPPLVFPPRRVADETRSDVAARQPTRVDRSARVSSTLIAAAPAVAAVTSPVDDTRRPLREAVRAHRIAVTSPQPTVVHVTIDRIDVRAPAANARPQQSPARPTPSSWKSLDEYLRHRKHAQGGDT